ncbi:Starch-binding associating with outer membrane [compost metagenome]
MDAATAQAGIKALYATNPTFLNKDVSITFTTTGGNQNPFYTEMVGLDYVQNVVASGTAVKAFEANKDKRSFALYNRLFKADNITLQDTVAYLIQGDFRGQNMKKVSAPSPATGANAKNTASAIAPVKLFSIAESKFLQAEAALKGWGTGTVSTLYNEGITASFDYLGT